MSDQQQRAEVIRYWWSLAEESLASARRELEVGVLQFAANRLYYCAFYAASAALLERQMQFTKHSGVRAAFHREFIKTRLLGVKWGKLYDQLFEDRQEADYVALTSFDRAYIESQLRGCAQLLEVLRPLVPSIPQA
jgi:uncharacterized protein (UPF0332 family)